MKILYNIFIEILVLGMKIAAAFNEKARKGILGRRESEAIVREKISETDRVIWMHAASLGEYEQGLPVLQQLKQKFPDRKVLVTFFSPSGYEIVAKKITLLMQCAICLSTRKLMCKGFAEIFRRKFSSR